MRVLMISPELPPMISGMADYAGHLAGELEAMGIQVCLLGNTSETPSNSSVKSSYQVLPVIRHWSSGCWTQIKEILQNTAPDLVHIQFLNLTYGRARFPYFLPVFLKLRFPKIPLVTTYHELAAPLKRLLLLPMLWLSSAHIVTNEHHLNALRKILFLIPAKSHLQRIPLAANIPQTVNDISRRENIREELRINADQFLLVRFGIIHDISLSGLVRFAEAVKQLRDSGITAKLLLLGKAEPRALHLLTSKIHELGAEDLVTVKSDLSPELVSSYLNAADLGLAYYPDGVSEKRTAFLSLLAHGLPVLGTRGIITPGLFEENNHLRTVPVDASSGLWAEQIRDLLINAQLRAHLSRGARILSQQYQWKNIAHITAELYQRVRGITQ